MSSRERPLHVYNKILLPLMVENEFELCSDSYNDMDSSRYVTRHQFSRRCPQPSSQRSSHPLSQRSHISEEQSITAVIDVIGIPMGSSLLLINAIICDQNRDEVKVKLKLVETNEKIKEKLMTELITKLVELLSTSINDLPLELKLYIMSLLPIETLFKMSLVSCLWRDIALDDNLWRVLVKKHFPDLYSRRVCGESWKAIYKEAYRNRKLAERRKSWATRGLPSSHIFPALPPSPPILPILGPPFLPMLPPPPPYFRDLIPEEVRNAFPNISARPSRISRPIPLPSINFWSGF